MIRSFRDRQARQFFLGQSSRLLPAELERSAQRKLRMLDAAEELKDLNAPRGNRLEKLRADREGQYSIRINDQWRICFEWRDGDAYDVEIVDYH